MGEMLVSVSGSNKNMSLLEVGKRPYQELGKQRSSESLHLNIVLADIFLTRKFSIEKCILLDN
jgi:hypothetical protein